MATGKDRYRKDLRAKQQKKSAAIGSKMHATCMTCQHAYLMQSRPENPVVCLCQITQERWVASCKYCISYKETSNNDIHEMIKAI